ncbi:MAG TPA: HAMP domain-containing sensor histidine kinase [Ramlibacter sp.]|nr:HAMP domain-containing sensor histidine kinase [Ramlibacter sp.]
MKPQAQQELAALRQALTEAREQLSAARAQAAERQSLLKKERAARALAERLNALKDEFLAIVSHELRGPLSAIAGWARILRLGTSEEDFDKGLEVIDQSVQAQTKLIEDLLDISRITSGQLRLQMQPLEPRSFIDAAAEAVRPAADAKGLHIRKVLDLAAGPIAGDPSRLQQVMVNLIANAVKFTPEQGRIELALRKLEDQVEISVADTGIGIPADFLPHVFDRFRQADASNQGRYGGLGLGLAIVKHLVELHGGSVSAQSPGEGGGATFVLRLPLMPQSIEPPLARPLATSAELHAADSVAAESAAPSRA